ncbi:MAG: sugar ABC transporter ATP-binding protein [Acidimicrobiia bacterium]|nr:sugar ABC transporter ATP-binding protein [Acidimicrobiia bacterium]
MLELKGITKRFPGVTALDAVDVEVKGGEVHVLLGENGAGKSTLAHVIVGSLQPDAGEFRFQGEEIRHASRHHARMLGIDAVFQEFSLVPAMTVQENLFLGREPSRFGFVDRQKIASGAREIFDRLGYAVDLKTPVASLSRGEQQVVEIAKALLIQPRLLVLDEPTSALTDAASERLFAIMDDLKAQGVGIIYITHRMAEIKRLGDSVTVLRDGRRVASRDVADVSDDDLIDMMAGRSIDDLYASDHARMRPGPVVLKADGLSTPDRRITDVSIEVRAGEIVGLAGIEGAGKATIGRACFGLEAISGGTVRIGEEVVRKPTPRRMLQRGLCYLPGDRRVEGLVLPRPVLENCSLASLSREGFSRIGFLRLRKERQAVAKMIDRLSVRTPSLNRAIALLSGGNQQKVILGRMLLRDVQVLILEEPTSGVDVTSRAEIYRLLRDLTEGGAAVVLISSDLPEVCGLADRAYVIVEGQVRSHLEGDALTDRAVIANMFQVDEVADVAS